MSDAFELTAKVCKVDESLGLVFGWAIVCEEDGQPYVDLQKDHVGQPNMLKVAAAFARGSRVAKDMHEGGPAGTVLFVWPLTEEIAKAFDIKTRRFGLLVGTQPTPEVLAKFRSGEYTGFSIGGRGKRRRVTA